MHINIKHEDTKWRVNIVPLGLPIHERSFGPSDVDRGGVEHNRLVREWCVVVRGCAQWCEGGCNGVRVCAMVWEWGQWWEGVSARLTNSHCHRPPSANDTRDGRTLHNHTRMDSMCELLLWSDNPGSLPRPPTGRRPQAGHSPPQRCRSNPRSLYSGAG